MRVGTNPVRNRYSVYEPKRVVVASITFAPILDGFFKEAIDVIGVHLHSLRRTVGKEADLLVFDNSSCQEVIDFLTEQHSKGIIDWLILSRHNLGKTGSLNWVFSMLPHEFIVSTDSDVLYRPGWLQRSLEIFAGFEQVGIVSAQPAFFNTKQSIQTMAERMSQVMPDIQIREEDPFPEAFEEYCDGINATDEVRRMITENRLRVATQPKGETQAVLGSTSMQFMIRQDVARQLVPLPAAFTLDSDDHQEINRRMEALGYFQLSLPDALIYHMGNTLTGKHMPEINQFRQNSGQISHSVDHDLERPERENIFKTILTRAVSRSDHLKSLIQRIYALLFDVLYAKHRR